MKHPTQQRRKKASTGYIIGRAGFAKISAVEGVRMTASMEADFHDFERRGFSAEERRKVIRTKYGKVR